MEMMTGQGQGHRPRHRTETPSLQTDTCPWMSRHGPLEEERSQSASLAKCPSWYPMGKPPFQPGPSLTQDLWDCTGAGSWGEGVMFLGIFGGLHGSHYGTLTWGSDG